MSANRIGRINEEIQKVLSETLRTLKDPRVQGLISITQVDTSGDLRYAKVYISVLDKDRSREVLKGLKSAAGFLRRDLGAKLQLRYTPELIFESDTNIEYAAHINELLKQTEAHHEDSGN
jgi:ribosome-binding factor A